MKRLPFSAAVSLALILQAIPAFAFSAQPTMRLIPLSTHVAVTGANPGCDAPAKLDEPFFLMPGIAAEEGATGTAQVKIGLTSGGSLAGEQLYATSGNRFLDEAALLSARMSRYTAETIGCEHVSGSYLYEVIF
jgi:hypothetical protein